MPTTDRMNSITQSILISDVNSEDKAHPWRRCPKGMHYVHEHQLQTHDGIVIVREHCAANTSKKEELSFDEIQYITQHYFVNLTGPPTPGVLNFQNGDLYDKEIRGWTQFWNDSLSPKEPLDPNLIKALIATESSFNIDPPANKIARGLMQLMPNTRVYLQDIHGELKNHLIRVTPQELMEPSTNICAGIRWLFRKKELARSKLKRESTWIEAVADYKDYLNDMIAGNPYNPKPMDDLKKYYSALLQGIS